MNDIQIINILREYIPRKKSIQIDESHSLRNSYTCANPGGHISNADCPDEDPLCNCPAREHIPSQKSVIISTYKLLEWQWSEEDKAAIDAWIADGKLFVVVEYEGNVPTLPEALDSAFRTYKEALNYVRQLPIIYDEPTTDELNELLEKTKECSKIQEVLGEDYLGCDWEDPNGFYSCNCPEVGPYFLEYLEHNNTIATFWNTEPHIPLYSLGQRALLNLQEVSISVSGDLTIRPGDVIFLEIDGVESGTEEEPVRTYTLSPDAKNSKFNGRWLVKSIKHKISGVKLHKMDLRLIRDSLPLVQQEGTTDEEA